LIIHGIKPAKITTGIFLKKISLINKNAGKSGISFFVNNNLIKNTIDVIAIFTTKVDTGEKPNLNRKYDNGRFNVKTVPTTI
jgi:hypothetical protein